MKSLGGPTLLILFIAVGASVMETTDALRINLQPWSLNRHRFHRPSLAVAGQNAIFDKSLMSTIFDDPFMHFPWRPLSFGNDLADFLPRQPHQTRCQGHHSTMNEADETNLKLLKQEKELESKEADLKQERVALEQEKIDARNRRKRDAEETRLQEQIKREREEIEQKEKWIQEQKERRRIQEEKYARREEVWMAEQRRQKEKEELARTTKKQQDRQQWKNYQMETDERGRNHQGLDNPEEQRLLDRNRREQIRGKQSHAGSHGSFQSRSGQQKQHMSPSYEIASLQIKGYNPEDITIVTRGNRMTVTGRHVCGCAESCFEREFQRGYTLPRGTDTTTIKANIDENAVLSIRGVKGARTDQFIDSSVSVNGHRTSPHNRDATCGGRKGGIKLKKMNKRTGQVVEDLETQDNAYDYFEGENEDDGITIEIIE